MDSGGVGQTRHDGLRGLFRTPQVGLRPETSNQTVTAKQSPLQPRYGRFPYSPRFFTTVVAASRLFWMMRPNWTVK